MLKKLLKSTDIVVPTGSALDDRDVLLRLFKASGGGSWKSCHGWATNNYIGGWFGVTTNAMSRVVEIYLTSNNLRGESAVSASCSTKTEVGRGR